VKNVRFALIAISLTAVASIAQAQATRTWVSGVGDDVNPCSRTAPCKTYAGAISKTAAGGEISTLDPGGFGAVTITKSITIDGTGQHGSILYSLTNGVTVNAGANDEVTLRNLSLNGAGNGVDGVRFLAGKKLTIEGCFITNGTGDGIEVSNAGVGTLLEIRNSTFDKMGTGMNIHPTGAMTLNISNVNVFRSTVSHGILINGPVTGQIVETTSVGASGATGSGVFVQGAATIGLDHVRATGNVFGVQTSGVGPNVRLKDCLLVGNSSVGLQNNGGTITTFQSNVIVGTGGVIGSTAPQ
jgi:hypothetical protein